MNQTRKQLNKYIVALTTFFVITTASQTTWGKEPKTTTGDTPQTPTQDNLGIPSISPPIIQEIQSPRRFLLQPYVELGTARNPSSGQTLRGIGGGIHLIYAVGKKIGLGGGIHERFSADAKFSALFTRIDAHLTWAVTGRLYQDQKTVALDQRSITETASALTGGLRLQVGFTEYLFSSSVVTIPFAGMGLAGYYEFSSTSNTTFQLGLRYDRISNSVISISPLSLFGGMTYRF